jgi:hypothetical protein
LRRTKRRRRVAMILMRLTDFCAAGLFDVEGVEVVLPG